MNRIDRLAWASLALALLQPPAAVQAQIVEYYHLDGQGSVRVVTNAAGAESERHEYLPFGDELSPPPGPQPRAFTGKERDAETGLDYFGGRYYAARTARFTTLDPVLDDEAARVDPQKWNRYAYGLNNPVRFVDPDGREVRDLVLGFGEGIGRVALGALMSTGALIESRGMVNPAAIAMGVSDAQENLQFLAHAARHPGDVVDAYVQLSTSRNPEDQRLLGRSIGTGTAVAALTLAPAAKGAPGPAQVQINRAAGNAFRDEIAGLLRQAGRDVRTEVYKRTPFGKRFIDIEVRLDGKLLGGIETKTGGSAYTATQRAKDMWLRLVQRYPVNVVRDR